MRKIYKIIVCFLFLIIIIGDEYETPLLTVYFFDVGQADCAYLSLPNGENMLIDCGNTLDGSRIVNYLSLMGVKKIDHLVLTHPHEDHIGGASPPRRKSAASIWPTRASAHTISLAPPAPSSGDEVK